MNASTDERRHAAYHEAGHAVVGCFASNVLKQRLVEIFITNAPAPASAPLMPPGKWRGYANFTPTTIPPNEPPEIAFAYAVQAAGGQIAEEKCGGNPDALDIEGDTININHWASQNAIICNVDVSLVEARVRQKAGELSEEQWPIIERVAADLLATSYEQRTTMAWGDGECHYLSGDQVRAIIDGVAAL